MICPNSIGLYDSLFHVSYIQSLIHFQQYITNSGSLLFQFLKEKKKQGSEIKKEYLKSSIFCAILALRSLLKRDKLEQSKDFVWSEISFYKLVQMVLEQMLCIILSRIKLLKLKIALSKPSSQKTESKLTTLKTLAYLISTLAN